MKKKIHVSQLVIMGDSLSDRGTFNKRFIFGVFPASHLHHLSRCSPRGRFTNGYVWSDHLASMLANDRLLAELKEKYALRNEEISDAILSQEERVLNPLRSYYHLNDDHLVQFKGDNLIRCYSEGGLTSFDYRWRFSLHPVRCFLRMILSTLAQKRKQLLDYDEQHQVNVIRKSQTLIIEWTGSNDLFTVNANPSFYEVDNIIEERIKNVKILIQKGYRHFLLFNLPNASLTPKFQNIPGKKGSEMRAQIANCTHYFNQNFLKACRKLQSMYLHCQIEIFDVNYFFTKLYKTPELFSFKKSMRRIPYIYSQIFCVKQDKTSPAKDYLFWDEIHPSASAQAHLAKEVYCFLGTKYKFQNFQLQLPQELFDWDEKTLIKAFQLRYQELLLERRFSFFSGRSFCEFNFIKADLAQILQNAIYDNGEISWKTLLDLQWINERAELKLDCPVLKEALLQVNKKFCCCCAAEAPT